jgi:hypothetical protein
MKKIIMMVMALGLMGSMTYAGDACLYGSATWKSGSKVDGTMTVSTSWNGKKAFPKNGSYRLCLGSNPKQKITVYVDGNTYTKLYVDGNTRLDIVRY